VTCCLIRGLGTLIVRELRGNEGTSDMHVDQEALKARMVVKQQRPDLFNDVKIVF
jgi:hypothetical protein